MDWTNDELLTMMPMVKRLAALRREGLICIEECDDAEFTDALNSSTEAERNAILEIGSSNALDIRNEPTEKFDTAIIEAQSVLDDALCGRAADLDAQWKIDFDTLLAECESTLDELKSAANKFVQAQRRWLNP